ncbi:MAG: response regulator, partial [Desulfuromonadales bacterium]|nr:response regulator [Desulfuromonadales bacterium]
MKRKVLVIDDDVLCLDILVEYLTYKNFEVTSSLCPTCAMIEQQATSCPMQTPCYETVLSDYHMPGMTGLELFQY